jgi:FkbM family methyltransferase
MGNHFRSIVRLGSVAVRRRIRKAGLFSVFSRPTPAGLIFIDLGLHKQACQTRKVLEWFGPSIKVEVYAFEANPTYFECSRRIFANEPRVEVINAAVVGPSHAGSSVELYLDGASGLGDSLFPKHNSRPAAVTVPAVRLSRFIKDRRLDEARAPILIRMNIEGAELLVLQDLIEAGLVQLISGWYGRWNDCAKIDPAMDAELQRTKSAFGIENFTFNDRDSRGRYATLREAIIRYDLKSSLSRALASSSR